MRFAAVQIPAKIGWCSLNGEKLDELHCVALIFGQFAVLHAHTARFLHASICKAACSSYPPCSIVVACWRWLIMDMLPEGANFNNPTCNVGRGCAQPPTAARWLEDRT